MSKVDFFGVVEAVLDGRMSVEAVEGVEPWPPDGSEPEAAVMVLMHRDVPGAVALFGVLDGASFLVGAYVSRLRSFLAGHEAKLFRFDSHRGPDGSVRFLFGEVARLQERVLLDPAFRMVCGSSGAELLRELKRVSVEESARVGGAEAH